MPDNPYGSLHIGSDALARAAGVEVKQHSGPTKKRRSINAIPVNMCTEICRVHDPDRISRTLLAVHPLNRWYQEQGKKKVEVS